MLEDGAHHLGEDLAVGVAEEHAEVHDPGHVDGKDHDHFNYQDLVS